METHHYKSTTHKEKFFHFIEAKINSPVGSHFNGGTVFVREEGRGIWGCGVSLCTKVDQFDRRDGRQWARRHYFERRNSNMILWFDEPLDYGQAANIYLTSALNVIEKKNNAHSG